MEWYIEAIKKYAVFSGRTSRKEFWMFSLVDCAIAAFLLVPLIRGLVGVASLPEEAWETTLFFIIFMIAIVPMTVLSMLYFLALIIPRIAAVVRRLHDTNRSGWASLLCLVPFVGWIILLVLLTQKGSEGENQYGTDPRISIPQ